MFCSLFFFEKVKIFGPLLAHKDFFGHQAKMKITIGVFFQPALLMGNSIGLPNNNPLSPQ